MSPWILDGLLGLHAGSTLLMTGLIWMAQVVHYPLFAKVGAASFCEYETAHTRQIAWLVGPLMVLEGATAVGLVWLLQPPSARLIAILGLGLLLVIWISTVLLQMPCHARLSRGFDAETLRRLVGTNWIRTIAWSARGLLAIILLRWV